MIGKALFATLATALTFAAALAATPYVPSDARSCPIFSEWSRSCEHG